MEDTKLQEWFSDNYPDDFERLDSVAEKYDNKLRRETSTTNTKISLTKLRPYSESAISQHGNEMRKQKEKTFIVEQRKIAFVVARNEDEAEEQVANLGNWDWIDQPLTIVEKEGGKIQ